VARTATIVASTVCCRREAVSSGSTNAGWDVLAEVWSAETLTPGVTESVVGDVAIAAPLAVKTSEAAAAVGRTRPEKRR